MKVAKDHVVQSKTQSIWRERGQSSLEYVVVCAALAFALGIGMASDTSVLRELIEAFKTAYEKISFALSLPM